MNKAKKIHSEIISFIQNINKLDISDYQKFKKAKKLLIYIDELIINGDNNNGF